MYYFVFSFQLLFFCMLIFISCFHGPRPMGPWRTLYLISRTLAIINYYQFFPSKFSRYHVGGIHESLEFQILTGVLVRGENIFWNIFISIAVVISGISMASLTLKRLVESFKDHRILHKVCINRLLGF